MAISNSMHVNYWMDWSWLKWSNRLKVDYKITDKRVLRSSNLCWHVLIHAVLKTLCVVCNSTFHRKQQQDLRLQLTRESSHAAEEGDEKSKNLLTRLKLLSRILDVIEQMSMQHEAFKDGWSPNSSHQILWGWPFLEQVATIALLTVHMFSGVLRR